MALTGVWMNELRSVLVLTEHEDKSLTGHYRSMAGRDSEVRRLSGRTSAVEGGKQMVAIRSVFRDRRTVDVTNSAEVEAAAQAVVERWKRIDVL